MLKSPKTVAKISRKTIDIKINISPSISKSKRSYNPDDSGEAT